MGLTERTSVKTHDNLSNYVYLTIRITNIRYNAYLISKLIYKSTIQYLLCLQDVAVTIYIVFFLSVKWF